MNEDLAIMKAVRFWFADIDSKLLSFSNFHIQTHLEFGEMNIHEFEQKLLFLHQMFLEETGKTLNLKLVFIVKIN